MVLKQSRGGGGSQSLVVVVDATRELSLSALQRAITNAVCRRWDPDNWYSIRFMIPVHNLSGWLITRACNNSARI